jgi:glycine cleavage system H protein
MKAHSPTWTSWDLAAPIRHRALRMRSARSAVPGGRAGVHRTIGGARDRIGTIGVMEIPAELRYSTDHEWVRIEGGLARIGITDFAQQALGDVVFIDLPELDEVVEAGAVVGEVESTKSVSELYAPVSGRVAEINAALLDAPGTLNEDPYGAGWICVFALADPLADDELLSAEQYGELTADS